jgi:prepilin-type N-terminal cleavage/methylation domain-containing protein
MTSRQPNGYTLIELLVALALSAILFAGLGSVVGQAIDSRGAVQEMNALTRQARFAMEQMVRAVSRSPRLLLPLNDSSNTNWPDNLREEPSAPVGDSTLSTAVLAVTLDPDQDLDGDGIPDADNDGDGRIDEDLPQDTTFDNAPGIVLIDDMGDGTVDKFSGCCSMDDEEDFGIINEDPINGSDDDGDGLVDEDPGSDMNGDGCPGGCGIDDDGDGQVDEGSSFDDDEDGQSNEDWYDPVVFYLAGNTLMQRTHVPWDEDGGGLVSGLDFIVEPIAENVTRLRVERVPQGGDRSQVVDLTLELTSPASGETVSLNTRVRVGGAL